MQATITVKEFCDKYLTSSQHILITDAEQDYIYFEGTAGTIQQSDEVMFNTRLLRIHPSATPRYKHHLELLI